MANSGWQLKPGNNGTVVKRHTLATRLWHWLNLICMIVLLMSGLQIFNAHPALYWGDDSTFDDPALAMVAIRGSDGELRGRTRVAGLSIPTTGILGVSGPAENRSNRGFPAWATLPSHQSLASGREWHFFFAWIFAPAILAYLSYIVIGGHLWRDLVPNREQWQGFADTVCSHLRLQFHPDGGRYNVLQKLTYLLVLFVIAPLTILTGLTMSPTMNTAWPLLLDIFGGRQSARTLHFICAFSLVGFFVVHVLLVLVSGVINNMRSMITGRYALHATDNNNENEQP